jgi:site-specific recombinase XerD
VSENDLDSEHDAVDGELMLALERTDDLTLELPAALHEELTHLLDKVDQYSRAAQSVNTTRAYRSDWRQFEAWCDRYGLPSIPASPTAVALHLTALAEVGRSVSTVRRRCAAIARAHRIAGQTSPTADPSVMTVLEGIARVHGSAPNKKTALLRDPLLEVIDRIDTSENAGLRDRAVLLVGFALGLRRSELVAIQVKDISPSPDGVTIRIARSKTDQQGRGTSLLLPYAESPNPCPVRALRAWLDASGITDGPVFRRLSRVGTIGKPLTPQSVALIIKRRADSAGLDPREFAGHSLRSGYATQAARDGHRTEQIANTTRHKDQTVLAGYIHAGRGRKDVAAVL